MQMPTGCERKVERSCGDLPYNLSHVWGLQWVLMLPWVLPFLAVVSWRW